MFFCQRSEFTAHLVARVPHWEQEGGAGKEEGKGRPSPLGVSKHLRHPIPAGTPYLQAAAHASALKITPWTLGRQSPLKYHLKYLNLWLHGS